MRFNQNTVRLQGEITYLKRVILKWSMLSFGSQLLLLAVLFGETGLTSVGDPPPLIHIYTWSKQTLSLVEIFYSKKKKRRN